MHLKIREIFSYDDDSALDAFHLAHDKLNKIRGQYLGDVVSRSQKVRSLLDTSLQENANVDTRFILTFIRILCDRLADRFPIKEVDQWSAFDCTANAQCQFEFGIEQ